jgi:surface antigen Omp85-like protein
VRTRIAAAILIGCCAAIRAQESAPAPTPPSTSGPRVELTTVNPADAPGPLPLAPSAIAPAPPARSAEKPGPGAPEQKGLDFIAAPIPISNPTIGTGLAGVAAIVFPLSKEDRISPPTTIGVGGFFTDNHSWALGAGGRLYLAEDRWRIMGVFVKGDIHYKISALEGVAGGGQTSVPVAQAVQGEIAEVLRRVSKTLFVGARYTHADTTLSLDASDLNSEAAPPLRDRQVVMAALGLRAQTDSRDSTFYPRRGTLFDLNADFYDPAFGGDRSYQSYKASVNRYVSVGDRSVVAGRLSACNVRGDAPIYALCLFGREGDLRGYEVGRFIDRSMWAAQAEYRWTLPEKLGFFSRFGLVGFAGVGEVANSFSDLGSGDLLPGGGVGVRYLLSRENPINFRIDYAWGKAGNKGVYLGVGESF